jgi:replicative DNA helicase
MRLPPRKPESSLMTTLFEDEILTEDEPRGDRLPPQNIHAEQCVIGGMLLSKDAITEVTEILSPGDYYRPAHEVIHRAILDVYGRGEPVDKVTVAAELSKTGMTREAGGEDYLNQCLGVTATAANAGWYAEEVLRNSILRRIIGAGTELVGIGFKPGAGTANEALDRAAGVLQSLTATVGATMNSREMPLKGVLDATMANYDSHDGNYLPLPYKDLYDKVPMEPGDFVVVAATPGTGKTTILADMARCLSIKHGRRSFFGSMEMPHTQIGQRILCAEARVDLNHFRKRILTDEERARIDRARARIENRPLTIDDSTAVPVSRMRTRLRQLQAVDQLPELYIVDYLQIAKAEAEQGANRTQEVDKLARDLRNLAMDFGIVVVAAAQLNRKIHDRADKVPQLSDLRESGGIEQACTIALMLDRPEVYDKETDRAGEIDIHVAKNRMGSQGVITLAYQGHYCRATDMAKD